MAMLKVTDLSVNYGVIPALKGISFEEDAAVTCENAKRFFGIEE